MANTPKDKQLYVVLIWSAIPEVPRMYKFPADKPVAALALASQSKYINGDVLPDNHPIFRPSIQVRLTVNSEVEVLASHLTPNSVVKAAIGLTGAWTDLGTTDSRGTIILTRKFAFDLGAVPGRNDVRLWVRNPGWDLVGSGFDTPVVFGPFEINL